MDFRTDLRSNVVIRRALALLAGFALMGLPLFAQPEAPATVEPVPATASQELTVGQIIAAHYEAIGGDEFQSVRTMKTSGTSVVMGMEAPYTRYSKRPNLLLLEIHAQGMTGVQAFDGETAWSFMPFMGQAAPEAMPPAQAQSVMEGSDFDGALVHAQKNGHRVELLGIEPVKGRDAYKLQVTMKTGGVQTHYVDTETFYVTRVESLESDVYFLDYELIEGHPVARVIEMMGPMGEQIVYVDEVEFDVPLEDSKFSRR